MKCAGRSFFRKGGQWRGLVKGKRWLLLTRWINLSSSKRQELNSLFALNRKLFKAYVLKESLDRLWNFRYEGAMLNYFQRWMDQLRWQRLRPFQKLADMLLNHMDGILNYCRTKVPLGMVEWKHQIPITPRPRVQKPSLPVAQSPTHGRLQNRIRGLQESSLK